MPSNSDLIGVSFLRDLIGEEDDEVSKGPPAFTLIHLHPLKVLKSLQPQVLESRQQINKRKKRILP